MLNWGQCTGVDLAQWPALKGQVERVSARPNVAEALRADGLLK